MFPAFAAALLRERSISLPFFAALKAACFLTAAKACLAPSAASACILSSRADASRADLASFLACLAAFFSSTSRWIFSASAASCSAVNAASLSLSCFISAARVAAAFSPPRPSSGAPLFMTSPKQT